MSQAGKAVRALLVANSTVNTNTGGRVRFGLLAQEDTYPAVTIFQIGSENNRTKSGVNDTDIEHCQISVYASTYDAAYTISDAARNALDGVGQQTVSGVDIDGIMFTNELALPYNDENDIVQVVQDYQVRVRR